MRLSTLFFGIAALLIILLKLFPNLGEFYIFGLWEICLTIGLFFLSLKKTD
jgi:hypothetical protein